jgi:hypothetical protein
MSSAQFILTLRAEALFTSSLQESQRPVAGTVRAVVADTLARYAREYLEEVVAQEAGDHPDLCQRRMQWALRAVRDAYGCPEASVAQGWSTVPDADHLDVPDVLQSLDVNTAGKPRARADSSSIQTLAAVVRGARVAPARIP